MTNSFDERVLALCGGRSPLTVQGQAADILDRTGRAIAVLPTGSGKTLLAALPFAAGLLHPKQMVFMTPLRTLTDAQTATLQTDIDPAAASGLLGLPWSVLPQTGTAPEDPLFTAPAVVCTFDQAISSALAIAYSTSPRRRTINAGAVLGSYLVADEIHLFPRDEALTTLLWLLKHRPRELPFLLMTATLSRPIAGALAELLDAELLDALPATDVARLGVAARARTVHWQEQPLTSAAIAADVARHPGATAIVVVNTVARARELGEALGNLIGWNQVLVLHSRFYPEDRSRIEAALRRRLGRDAERGGQPFILVATQVVEAGLDISADFLFTEWAPANALVQRWGRCARWGGAGQVIVAPPVSATADALPSPYVREIELRPVLIRTREWLRQHASGGIRMTDETERALLDEAHGAADEAWVASLERRLAEQAVPIGEAIQSGLYSHAGGLIRRVDNRTVLIHGAPETIDDPWHVAGFSLAVGTLHGLLRGRSAPRGEPIGGDEDDLVSFDLPTVPWVLKRPVWPDERRESQAMRPVGWEPATPADLGREALFAVNPALVSYDLRLGLGLAAGSPVSQAWWGKPIERQRRGIFSPYQRETYAHHVAQMVRLLDQRVPLWPTQGAIAESIEAWCGWPPEMLRRVLVAAIVYHDAGKLTDHWQNAIRAYQHAGGHPYEAWLVHTDEERGLPFKPGRHALAGAAHSLALGERFDQEVIAWREATASPRWEDEALPSRVLFTAIATHHGAELGPTSTAVGTAESLPPPAIIYLKELLRLRGLPDVMQPPPIGVPLDTWIVSSQAIDHAGNDAEYLAIAVVSRLLRLSDGWSQEADAGAVSSSSALSETSATEGTMP